MKYNHKNIISIIILLFCLIINTQVTGQKINLDSLLINTIKETNITKNYQLSIKKYQKGVKLSPQYLDFHLQLGRAYQLTKSIDSARFYYNYVINKNSSYEEAYLNLINLELEANNYDNAEIVINKAIDIYPEKDFFYLKKMVVYQLKNQEEKEYDYLKQIALKFPNNTEIKQRIYFLNSKKKSQKAGINYGITAFNRNNYGPWHYVNLHYINEQKWGSIIGNINYINRLNNHESTSGFQYEIESYLFNFKNAYSYIDLAYSNARVFPLWRLGYSYNQNFKKGWEADLGFRYTKTDNLNIKTYIIGVGKYVGSWWVNVKTYIQDIQNKYYPGFSVTSRYYLDTKYDYFTFNTGYGTAPDERILLGQFEQRITLQSYRIGAGYSKVFKEKYITSIQATYNRQEYAPQLRQNELDMSLKLQYKF